MMRSSSIPLHELDDSSSLDQLANSSTDRLPMATRSPTRSPSPPKRRLSSPTKTPRNKRKSQEPSSPVSTYSFAPPPASPSRTVTEQTLSPWKIRVTVETEHEDGREAGDTTTRTIKVPLREESSPLNPERATARGRRSAPASAKTKRSGTPVRRRSGSRSRSRRPSVTDLNIAPLGDDGDSDEWTLKKRSPRKKRPSRSQRAESEQSVEPRFEIHQDADEGIDVGPDEIPLQSSPGPSQSPELRQIDLNRVSVRTRAQSTKGKDGRVDGSDVHAGSEPALQISTKSDRKVSATSAASYPTPSPTSSYPNSDEVEKDAQEHEHYDTIMESEGFTMIDLETVPSIRQFRNSPEEPTLTHEQPVQERPHASKNDSRTPQSKTLPLPISHKQPTPIPSYLTADDDESELSSNVPSSPPPAADTSLLAVPTRSLRSSERKVTPNIYSSPSLPPPPPVQKAPISSDRHHSASKQVVNAGMALQGVVTSPDESHNTSSRGQSSQPHSSTEAEFFTGFSSGTKRELRAGLRFGEELAKRQGSASLSSDSKSTNVFRDQHDKAQGRNMKRQPRTQVWRGEAVVQHSPFATESLSQTKSDGTRPSEGRLESNALSSSKSKARRTPSRLSEANIQNSQLPSSKVDISQFSTAARKEHEWQLEREAVSRKIDDADANQVIVLDEDDEVGGQNVVGGRASLEARESKVKGRRIREIREEAQDLPQRRHEADQSFVQDAAHSTEISRRQIDGNDIDEDDEDDDIWLQEAKDNSSSPRDQDPPGMFTRTEQRRQQERAAEVTNKPRRSMIPSPWKRGEDVAEASTFMSDGAMSGIFWQQPPAAQEAIKFGAGEIARQKRSTSGNFDLDTMLSSPVKVATAGKQNLLLTKSDEHQYRKHGSSEECEDDELLEDESQADEVSEVEESQQDVSDTAESQSSSASSSVYPQTIPVNFNDSTLSGVATTPPRQLRPSPTEAAERARLTPPRSAMKGGRLSFSPIKPETQSELRQVVFSERSLYLNSDGDESSMSANFDSPLPETKPRQIVEISAEEVAANEETAEREKKSGWLNWMVPGKSPKSVSKLDGTDEGHQVDGDRGADEEEEDSGPWESAKVSIPTTANNNTRQQPSQHPPQSHNNTNPPPKPSQRTQQPQPQPTTAKPKPKLPSYLLPPSYPSDPTRSPTIPLSTSGNFTNTHFRTLHIIHAKSQRPRFHAPRKIRRSIRSMLGWKMGVDESGYLPTSASGTRTADESGGGEVFEWTLGTREAEVLERFMQEVEFGYVDCGVEMKAWGWGVEELARSLGMVVIGEVVRMEEGRRG